MKVLHLADLHAKASTLDVCGAYLAAVTDIVKKESVKVVLFAGDIYDHSVPGQKTINLLTSWFRQIAELGVYMEIIVGNHDIDDKQGIDGLSILETVIDDGQLWGKVHLYRENSLSKVQIGSEILQIVAIPFPPRMMFVAEGNPDKDEQIARGNIYVKDGIKKIMAKVDPSIPAVGMMHFGVQDCQIGQEQSVPNGTEIQLKKTDIPDTLKYVAFGHYHSEQVITENARYAGSGYEIDYSEEGCRKGVVLVDSITGKSEFVSVKKTVIHKTIDITEENRSSLLGILKGVNLGTRVRIRGNISGGLPNDDITALKKMVLAGKLILGSCKVTDSEKVGKALQSGMKKGLSLYEQVHAMCEKNKFEKKDTEKIWAFAQEVESELEEKIK